MNKIITISFFTMIFVSCKKDNDNPGAALVRTDTLVSISSYFYGNGSPGYGSYNNNNAFVNLYDKEIYSANKVIFNPGLAEKVDFGYVYKQDFATSWLRMLANPQYLSTTSTAVGMPLTGWSVKTSSFISSTTLSPAAFDSIKTDADLNVVYEQQKDNGTENGKKVNLNSSYSTDDLRQPPVFLFRDHAGRKGFIRLLPYTSKTNYDLDPSYIKIIFKMAK
jgi:hypothetical protein